MDTGGRCDICGDKGSDGDPVVEYTGMEAHIGCAEPDEEVEGSAEVTISDAQARRIASYWHSPSPRDRNITAVSHGLNPPDGEKGLIAELRRELVATGHDPGAYRELAQLLAWAKAL